MNQANPAPANTTEPHSGNSDVEYQMAISYIHHMYDTRNHIFQFAIALNTGLIAVVFQFLDKDIARIGLSLVGGIATLVITLMAKRSWLYLLTLESYTKELEKRLNFHLISETALRMPKGIDSTLYLYYVYWLLVVTWITLSTYYSLRMFAVISSY
ncbi:MAG: hypothetical protein U1C48_10145 [Methylotenera sp.]|nr:hypothetical protein [Methylotenera sp.]